MQVYPHADNSRGVYHCVYAGFGVVAHEESAELQTGAEEPPCGVVPQLYFGVVVLKV